MEQFKIGDKVYFIDIKSKQITENYVVGTGISTTGYLQYLLKDVAESKNIQFRADFALVFATMDLAKDNLDKILNWNKQMNDVLEANANKLDELRKSIIGEPEFEFLLEKKENARRDI